MVINLKIMISFISVGWFNHQRKALETIVIRLKSAFKYRPAYAWRVFLNEKAKSCSS